MIQALETEKSNNHCRGIMAIAALGLLVCGILLCSKAGAIFLIAALQHSATPLSAPDAKDAQVIVVLTGGEYRIHETARLHHETGLPVLASGGYGEAAAIKNQLEKNFLVTVQWTEDNSLNTEQNALYSSRILAKEHIQRIILVTHALHMRRARMMFSDRGLEVIAAPTDFLIHPPVQWRDFLPSAEGRKLAKSAFHEIGGMMWYQLRRIIL